MDPSRLLLAAACGAAFLTIAAAAFVGGRRALGLIREASFVGALLALFVGTAVESLSLSLAEAPPYAWAFLSTDDLHVQALLEDPDLRTRYNVDPRLRYIPAKGERVVNLESGFRLASGPFRTVDFAVLQHASPVATPTGVEPVSMDGDSTALRGEVAGLYETATSVAPPDATSLTRLDFCRSASVGLSMLGLVLLLAGTIPLLLFALATARDVFGLARMTSGRPYRGARGRAFRLGAAALARWNFRSAGPFATLATFGLLAFLVGIVMGLRREDETRRLAHDVFRAARQIRIEAKK